MCLVQNLVDLLKQHVSMNILKAMNIPFSLRPLRSVSKKSSKVQAKEKIILQRIFG